MLCFSEAHQTHHCDAIEAISQAAENLVETLKSDAERLVSRRSRIHEIQSVLADRERKYEAKMKGVDYNDECAEQLSCTTKDEFEVRVGYWKN